jgi:hypothetical protein
MTADIKAQIAGEICIAGVGVIAGLVGDPGQLEDTVPNDRHGRISTGPATPSSDQCALEFSATTDIGRTTRSATMPWVAA